MEAVLTGRLCRVRAYCNDDARTIRSLANDFFVSQWLTRRFPFPYTQGDAERWIARATGEQLGRHFAIEVEGELAGGAGYEPCLDERSGTAEFGYWLGRRFWGRGIATEAARMLSDYLLRRGALRRLEAGVFAPNVASARVLEKCGFSLEGRLRALYVDRQGQVQDALLFGRVASGP
jgi:RimJ/RimL family protein N-acetyltransferase